MIKQLLPITENKLKILKYIYDNKDTYLLNIAQALKIHPFSLKRTIDNLIDIKILERRSIGKTIVLSINEFESDLLFLIEKYKLETLLPKSISQNILIAFKGEQVLCCCVFGSYARGSVSKDSDLDLLFVLHETKMRSEIIKKCSELSISLNRPINPVIFDEVSFNIALKTKDPAMASMLIHSQRLILFGVEYFLQIT